MKVTSHLFIAFLSLFVLFTTGYSLAQTPIPEKIDENNWGYKSSDNTVLIDGLEKTEAFKNGVGFAKKNGKWGAFSPSMEQIIPFQYEQLWFLNNRLVKGTRNDYFYLFSLEGKSVGPTNLTDVNPLRKECDSLIVANKNGTYGMINSEGSVLIPLVYHGVPYLINQKHLLVYKKKRKSFFAGVIDLNNDVIVPFKYLFIRRHHLHYQTEAAKSNKLNYYNHDGKIAYTHKKGTAVPTMINKQVIITQADDVQELQFIGDSKKYKAERWYFQSGFYRGVWNEKTTLLRSDGFLMEKEGEWSVNPDTTVHILIQNSRSRGFDLYDKQFNLMYSEDEAAPVSWSNRWLVQRHPIRGKNLVLIDLNTRKPALKDTFSVIELMQCDYVRVTVNKQSTLYNDQLERIFKNTQSTASPYLLLPLNEMTKVSKEYEKLTGEQLSVEASEGNACDKSILPLDGKVTVRLITDASRKNPLPDRLYVQHSHTENNGICITDMQGKMIVPFGHDIMSAHHQGLLESFINDTLDHGSRRLYGVINTNGEVVIPHRYKEIVKMTDTILTATFRGRTEVVDLRTKEVIIGGFNGIHQDALGFFHISNQGLWGIADPKGNVLIPPKYQEIIKRQEEGGLYKVKHLNKQFYVDLNGNEFPIE